MENLLTTLFPTKCYFCNTGNKPFCRNCLEKCIRVDKSICIVCEQLAIEGQTHVFCHDKYIPNRLFSAFRYKGVVRECIRTAKYSSKLFYPLKLLTYKASKLLSTSGFNIKEYLIIPIPLSKKKARSRGFNQAELIGNVLANDFKLQIQPKALIRVKETLSQYKETREERFKNLENAFLGDKTTIKGSKVLVVDDICTSGATLFEATRALKAAGATDVVCFSLAKKFLRHRKGL